MAQKWNLQDIVPPDRARRSTRTQAESPQRQTSKRQSPVMTTTEEERPPRRFEERMREPMQPPREPVPPQETTYESADFVVDRIAVTDGRLARLRKYIFSAVAVAVVIFIGFSITLLMSGATLEVTPKTHETTVQASFEAKLKPEVNGLGYELLTLGETGEEQVVAKGEEEVKEHAKGNITVYNAFSTSPQRLVKSTRFESKGGLIYRASEGITIPGYTKDASGSVVPGKTTVEVVADGSGEQYNIVSERLTIPGLKGGEQYETMYAEADATGIAGGFEGKKVIIDDTELATIRQRLHGSLRDKLIARLKTERPNGFITFDQAVTLTFESLPPSQSGNNAILRERALLHVPLFSEAGFGAFIARNTYPGYDGSSVRIEHPQELLFGYEGMDALTDVSSLDTVRFTLSGKVRLIWQFDEEALISDLLGKTQKDLEEVLVKYPGIDRAQAVIRPLWSKTFPSSKEGITVHNTVTAPTKSP